MVRSWRPRWLGHLASRRWLHFRARHLRDVQPFKRTDARLQSPSVGHGGIQLVSRQKCGNNILGSQLLLPLRKPSSHNGTRRCIEVLLLAIWPCAQTRGAACHTADSRLLPLVYAPPNTLQHPPRKRTSIQRKNLSYIKKNSKEPSKDRRHRSSSNQPFGHSHFRHYIEFSVPCGPR